MISIVHYGGDVDGNYDIDSDDDGSSNENDFGSDDDGDDNFTKSSCVLWWLINQTNLKMDQFYRSVS